MRSTVPSGKEPADLKCSEEGTKSLTKDIRFSSNNGANSHNKDHFLEEYISEFVVPKIKPKSARNNDLKHQKLKLQSNTAINLSEEIDNLYDHANDVSALCTNL